MLDDILSCIWGVMVCWRSILNQRTALAGEVMAFWGWDLLALAWSAAKNKKPVIMLSSESVAVAARLSGSEPQTKPVVVHTTSR